MELHRKWIRDGKTAGLIYICGDEYRSRSIHMAAQREGLTSRPRIELLDTIQQETIDAFEAERAKRTRAAMPCQRGHIASGDSTIADATVRMDQQHRLNTDGSL